jgi:hypothetical protein
MGQGKIKETRRSGFRKYQFPEQADKGTQQEN